MNLKHLTEVLLFASPEPLTQVRFNHILQNDKNEKLAPIINALNEEYKSTGKGIKIMKIAGGYQILSHSEYHIYLDRLFKKTRKPHLSDPSLEALAIVAYRQPITKSEIEAIRGVECGSVISTLMEREFISVKGRGSGHGRPLLFGTTRQFLKLFGLKQVSDLPQLKELDEIRNSNQNIEFYSKGHASE